MSEKNRWTLTQIRWPINKKRILFHVLSIVAYYQKIAA